MKDEIIKEQKLKKQLGSYIGSKFSKKYLREEPTKSVPRINFQVLETESDQIYGLNNFEKDSVCIDENAQTYLEITNLRK